MSMKLMVDALHAKVGNPLRKLILVKLADNANDLGECWPSLQHVADQCEISKSSVARHITGLKESGFLSATPRFKDGEQQSNMYLLTIPKDYGGVSERIGGVVTVGTPPIVTVTTRTSNSFEPVIEPTDRKEKVAGGNETAKRVFEYWRTWTGHQKAVMDEKRIARIKSMLKKFSEDDLKEAIYGVTLSPFHMGENKDNKKYNGIETIFRDAAQVEKFMEISKAYQEE